MGKTTRIILGLYDLLLATIAIITGVLMLAPGNSVFASFPERWKTFGLLDSWIIPGLVSILLIGVFNCIAGLCCFFKGCKNPDIISGIMGGLLIIAVACQLALTHEWYMASVECFIAAILQLAISYGVGKQKND